MTKPVQVLLDPETGEDRVEFLLKLAADRPGDPDLQLIAMLRRPELTPAEVARAIVSDEV